MSARLRPASRLVVILLAAVALVGTGCVGGGPGDVDAASTTAPTSATTEAPSTSTTGVPSTTTDDVVEEDDPGDLPEGVEPTDHLTLASGVIVVSFDGDPAAANASTALRAIDGAPEGIGFTTDATPPVVYVFELPALTTFDRFAVPDVRDSPGNLTFFGSIEIAGSAVGPAEEGFEVLVAADFEELGPDETVVELAPSQEVPVRWIRLTLSGALVVEARHETGSTSVEFTELIGNGTQEDVPLSDRFNGVWDLRFTDSPANLGPLLELKQQGSTVTGCFDTVTLTGTVTGSVARVRGLDARDGKESVYVFTVTAGGELRGVESTNGGVFRSRFGPIAPAGTTTPCSDAVPAPPACGATVYINFDVNSADIRPDSERVLVDLFEGLRGQVGGDITIEGHTSTEGSTDYNQDLSERRARAVVDDLVAKGLDPTRVTAVGKGETEPLVDDRDEASRAINRRVEVICT